MAFNFSDRTVLLGLTYGKNIASIVAFSRVDVVHTASFGEHSMQPESLLHISETFSI